MSYGFEVDIKGEQDLGAITPQEMFEVFMTYDIDRINFCHCLYEIYDKKTYQTLTRGSIDIMSERQFCNKDGTFNNKKFEIKQLNKWSFDIN